MSRLLQDRESFAKHFCSDVTKQRLGLVISSRDECTQTRVEALRQVLLFIYGHTKFSAVSTPTWTSVTGCDNNPQPVVVLGKMNAGFKIYEFSFGICADVDDGAKENVSALRFWVKWKYVKHATKGAKTAGYWSDNVLDHWKSWRGESRYVASVPIWDFNKTTNENIESLREFGIHDGIRVLLKWYEEKIPLGKNPLVAVQGLFAAIDNNQGFEIPDDIIVIQQLFAAMASEELNNTSRLRAVRQLFANQAEKDRAITPAMIQLARDLIVIRKILYSSRHPESVS